MRTQGISLSGVLISMCELAIYSLIELNPIFIIARLGMAEWSILELGGDYWYWCLCSVGHQKRKNLKNF